MFYKELWDRADKSLRPVELRQLKSTRSRSDATVAERPEADVNLGASSGVTEFQLLHRAHHDTVRAVPFRAIPRSEHLDFDRRTRRVTVI